MAKRHNISSVLEENALLKKRLQEMAAREKIYLKKIADLETKLAQVLERLAKLENPKNSRNSSVPPSKDENRPRKTESLRKKSGKMPGGQPGRKGNTLTMTGTPDKILLHLPECCTDCGRSLADLPTELLVTRQVVDLPPIRPEYTEHQTFRTACPCGCVNDGVFPPGINAPIKYGPNIESLIGYFHSRQYLPYDRMREALNDVFGLKISEGGIHSALDRLTDKARPVYESIRARIARSRVVGTDETGMKVNGKNHWCWTWQNDKFTFNAASDNRGRQTINENFPQGFPLAVMVHDCWKSHFNAPADNHQMCLAHLLRELEYLTETIDSPWPALFKKLLNEAIATKKNMNPKDYSGACRPRDAIEKRADELLAETIEPKFKNLVSFQKRIIKYRDHLFVFLHRHEVPPDNNGSERAIRNVKVKLKVSGQFKSAKGAARFALLRSITDTAIKKGYAVTKILSRIAKLSPA